MALGWRLPFLILILFLCPRSYAVLGEAAISGGHGRIVQAQTSHQSLSVQERIVGNTTIREYLDAGRVYAVTWRGNKDPDVSSLVGPYYGEYSIATASTLMRHARRSLAAVSENLEVHRFGHMGDLHGVVVLKNLLPPGVKWIDLP